MKNTIRLVIGILIAVAGIGAIGAIVYYGWGTVTSFVLPAPPAEPEQEALTAQLKSLSDSAIFDYWTNEGAREIYAVGTDGQIFLVRDTEDQNFSKQIVNNLNKVVPSPDGRRVAIGFGNPRRSQFSLYSVADRAWSPLPIEILNLAWFNSPGLGDILAFSERQPFVSLEAISLPAGASPSIAVTTLIKDVGLEDVDFNWVSPSVVRLIEPPSASYRGEAWTLNLSDLTLAQTLPPQLGLIVKWSADGLLGLKFSSPDGLGVINPAGDVLQKLPFVTLPHKCALEKKLVYCFVPRNPESGPRLPDDYLQKAFYSLDDLYRFNLEGGENQKLIDDADLSIDGFNPKIFGGQILFINRYDQKLYSFSL